ncbi:MAG: SCP2 sterol-binding domain-containing protein [Actinomycetota bacterium]
MNQVISGCPFEPTEVRTFIDTSDGTMRTGKGEVDGAEVTLHTDWETSRKIIVEQDQQAAMQAFMSGKIKVVGDMTKLMTMNATPPTDAQKAAAEDIKNLTA